jgi:hypothetical protein
MAFQEAETNNTLLTANTVTVNSTFQGSMGANGDLDYFRIQPSAGGLLTMNFTHPGTVGTGGGNIRLQLRDSNDVVIAYKDFTGSGKFEATVPSSGNYYVTVVEADKYTNTFTEGIYSVATTFVSDANSAYDGASNNTIDSAVSKLSDGVTTLTPGGVVTGTLGAEADTDYFKLQSSTGGLLTMNFTHPGTVGTGGGNIRLQLRDSNDVVIAYKDFTGSGKFEATVPSSGNYYVTVVEADKYTNTFTEGIYSVATTFVSDANSAYDGASNNTIDSAVSKLSDGVTTLTPGGVVTGTLGAEADTDYFKLQSSTGGLLTMNFTHPGTVGTGGGNIRLQLRDSNDVVIAYKDFTGSGKFEATVPSSGNYYVTVVEADKYTNTFTEGIYSVATTFVSDANSAYDGASNNTIDSAVSKLSDGVTTLTPGGVVTGTLGAEADTDYFKLQSSTGGLLTMNFTHPGTVGTGGGNIRLQLRDSNDVVIAYKDFTGSGKFEATVPSSGNYYVTVVEADKYTNTFTEGIYSVATTFVSDANSAYDGASNNTIDSAVSTLSDGVTTLTPGGVVTGTLSGNADTDYFKLQISAGGLLTMNFTHPGIVGTGGGNIKLQLRDSNDAVIAFKDFTASGKFEATVPSSGNYYVTVVEADKYTNTFTEGIYSIKFGVDSTAPTVSTFSPADEASSVAITSNIVLTFSEAVQRGTGNIVLKASGATVASYDSATSSNLSISGSTLTINPTADLSNNTAYSIEFAAGTIKDIAGNSYVGTTTYNFTTVAGSTPTLPLTKAKIYLGVDDSFSISNSGAALYGNSGTDAVTIAVGTAGGVIDQNVERVNFSGASSSYTFKQTGNKINVYDAAGATLLASAPVQGDADGTVLSFSNGVASATIQSGGVMLLGGATVNAIAATLLTPTLTISPAPTSGLTKAKVYMGVDDIFTVSSSGTTLYGNSGTDTITMAAGTTNVSLDQNVERINFPGASSSYTFKQTGNKINIYDAAGTTLLASTPVQGDADGTVLAFSNVTASATIQTGGVMKLGTATVSATAATAISLNTAVAVSGAGTSSAANGDFIFNVAMGNYTYSISGFGTGDKIAGPTGVTGTLDNSSFSDGSVTLQYAQLGQVVQITLTGLTSAQDGALHSLLDLNTIFGSGTIV